MAGPTEEQNGIQQMADALVAGVASPSGTTFSDLIFGNVTDPWFLVAIGLISALTGMITHWAKVHFQEPNTVSFYEWFFVTNKRGSIIAVLSMLGALFAAFGPLDYTTITAYQVFAQAWSIGYAADSMFNSGSRGGMYGPDNYSNYTPGYRADEIGGDVPGYDVAGNAMETPDRPPSAAHM